MLKKLRSRKTNLLHCDLSIQFSPELNSSQSNFQGPAHHFDSFVVQILGSVANLSKSLGGK